METTRILLIGAGTISSIHAKAYVNMDEVKVVGVVDPDDERASDIANRLSSTPFSSWAEACAQVEFDVVDVCVPTYLHKDYVVKAANAHKQVICEKPIALSVSDAKDMIDVCRENGVQLMIAHVVRFSPNYVRAKALVESGSIGDVGVARTFRGGSHPFGWDNWYADSSRSGGILVDLGIHDFDFLRWTFGEVKRVFTKRVQSAEPRLDYTLSTLRFESGVIAHVEHSWAHTGFSTRFEFAGPKGIIDEDTALTATLTVSKRATQGEQSGVIVPQSPVFKDPYALELEHFLSVIRDGVTPRLTAEDALRALEISLACNESAATGKVISL